MYETIIMKCRLCLCPKGIPETTITTVCQHTFHVNCLGKKWAEKSDLSLSCPVCQKVLGCVHNDELGHCYVGIDGEMEWVAYYTVRENRIVPVKRRFTKWKRTGQRLQKHESISMLNQIVVS